jgi:hypothetical protein
MNNKVDFLNPDEPYNPRGPDWEKIRQYKDVE